MTGEGITVEKLYELCDTLDGAKDTLSEHEKEYGDIMGGTKGGNNEKRLASQLIVRYFYSFPNSKNKALDAMFELCEDDDATIRKFVIKDLPSLCKESGDHVSKVADVLTQLLQSDDSQEQMIVQNALMILLNKYTKETLTTIFGHVLNEEEDLIRERAVKFLALKLKSLSSSVMTKEIQDYIFEESKKVMQDVTGDEFVLFMHVLSNLSQLQTVTGRKQLLDLVTEQADLEKSFQAEDTDRVDQICQCVKQAVHFFSKNVQSTTFAQFMLGKVLPVLQSIEKVAGGENTRLECLRMTSELAPTCGDLAENWDKHLDTVFQRLMEYLPLPPSESGEAAVEGAATEAEPEEPKIEFSEVEALLWTLHQLGKKYPQFLTDAKRADEVKEFRKRLQYMARVIQVYSKKLKQILGGMKKEELASDENKIKVLALRTTSNIQVLVKDLLHTTPTYKSTISPSWKPLEKAVSDHHRRGDDHKDEPPRKRDRQDRKPVAYYAPPSGKFSTASGVYKGPENSTNVSGGGYRAENRTNGGGGGYRGNRGAGRGRGYGRSTFGRRNWRY